MSERAIACSSGVIARAPLTATAIRLLLLLLTDVLYRRGDAVVRHWNLDPHRLFARVLLENFRAETRDPADDEQQPADHGRKTQIDEDRRERSIDVQRNRFDPIPNGVLERTREAHAVARKT